MKRFIIAAITALFVLPLQTAVGDLIGPLPYLSSADIPEGFYANGVPDALEDFEDRVLDFGITASNGYIQSGTNTDSVDADDGSIDGSGENGKSWFFHPGSTGITFTFESPVTAAGIVWTDGAGLTTFEAFGPGMVSLGTIGPVDIADEFYSGETAEDRFFGVIDLDGIIAVKLSNSAGAIEVDHVQYGAAVPEPSTIVMWFLLGTFGFVCFLRKRQTLPTRRTG